MMFHSNLGGVTFGMYSLRAYNSKTEFNRLRRSWLFKLILHLAPGLFKKIRPDSISVSGLTGLDAIAFTVVLV